MSATVKDIAAGQSKIFWVYFMAMMFFFCVDLMTDFLVVTGYTARQVGGDLAKDAYQGLFLIMLSIARADGEKLVNTLKQQGGSASIQIDAPQADPKPEPKPEPNL